MDRLIARYDAEPDGDLMLCNRRGVAFQRDMSNLKQYDDEYFQHYVDLRGSEIAKRINAGRVAMVDKHAGAEREVLDVGIGSGEFIDARPNSFGYDVNPRAIQWLEKRGLWRPDFTAFSAFTFWDVIEHVPDPNSYFRHIGDDSYLFTSIPIFDDLKRVRESKHFKLNEHLAYWTEPGFVQWMAEYRFRLLDTQDFEIAAGRDSIKSFAFKRDLPGYHDTVAQYKEMHSTRFYGASAWQYLDFITEIVKKMQPRTILDYGCGRSDLAAHFYLDGKRRIAKYDPAIPDYKEMPEGRFDLVLCTDLLEHIRMEDVDRILREIHEKSNRVIFTISLKPARAKLPDGRNAHVTLLTESEWTRWVQSYFGRAVKVKTKWEHLLMLKTWK